MKNNLLVYFFILTSLTSQLIAQTTVSIPDTNFLNAIIKRSRWPNIVDKNFDNKIQVNEAITVKKLELFNASITDLTGIEAFTSLTNLNIGSNKFKKTPDLSKNLALDSLYNNGNPNLTLDLSHNTALTLYYCNGNNYTTISMVQARGFA